MSGSGAGVLDSIKSAVIIHGLGMAHTEGGQVVGRIKCC